jgi:hypothetical protein
VLSPSAIVFSRRKHSERVAATGILQKRTMIKRALMLAGALLVVACNPSPSQSPDNTVGGSNVVSSAKTPLTKGATSLSLDWGRKGQAGQVAIADVLSYGGSKPTIAAPAGWKMIRDDSTKTTRQSLYWHAIQASDPSTATWTLSEPADAQGAVVLLDNVAASAPVDMTSGDTGEGGTMTAKSVATTSDGDLVLAFNATDFGAYRHTACTICDGLNPKLPPDVTVVLNHESTALEYWILSNYQNQLGDTEIQVSDAPQVFNWVAAQVAIKRGAVTSPTP